MDVASGADRHLGITFGLQAVESSFHVSVLFREVFSHPYINFFHLLVNCFSICHKLNTQHLVLIIGRNYLIVALGGSCSK